jgi:DNA mismatch repair ATPase MutS
MFIFQIDADEMPSEYLVDNLEFFLEDIYDVERLHRRIDIGNLHPYELNHLFLSFYQTYHA